MFLSELCLFFLCEIRLQYMFMKIEVKSLWGFFPEPKWQLPVNFVCFETGAAFTRFQTMRLQKIFPEALSDKLISYGSCQFPTLGFVVERYKQVQAFIPEPFWKIKGIHVDPQSQIYFVSFRCTTLYIFE